LRFARFVRPGGIAYGIIEGTDVEEISTTPFLPYERTGVVHPLSSVRLLAPCLPSKIVAIGHNYLDHIAERSPLQPVGTGDPLDKNKLDDYLADVNRHPGRMVDVVVTPTLTPGVVNLDYLVAEDRPWTLSSDYSNSGTSGTGKDRQHFGFADYQLTGQDDVLLLDYMTSGFSSQMNAVNGSYEGRIPVLESTRWRVGDEHDVHDVHATVLRLMDLSFRGGMIRGQRLFTRWVFDDPAMNRDMAMSTPGDVSQHNAQIPLDPGIETTYRPGRLPPAPVIGSARRDKGRPRPPSSRRASSPSLI